MFLEVGCSEVIETEAGLVAAHSIESNSAVPGPQVVITTLILMALGDVVLVVVVLDVTPHQIARQRLSICAIYH